MTTSPFDRVSIRVPVADEWVTIPPSSAAVWIRSVMSPSGPPGALLELMTTQDRQRIALRLGRRHLSSDDMASAMHDALRQAVPGSSDDEYPWWVSYRLLAASATPSVAGRMTLARVDPRACTPAEWCYAEYEMLVKGLDTKQRFRLDTSLTTPPEGVEDDEWGDMDFDQMVATARSMPGMS